MLLLLLLFWAGDAAAALVGTDGEGATGAADVAAADVGGESVCGAGIVRYSFATHLLNGETFLIGISQK